MSYAGSQAILGKGTTVGHSTTSGGTYTLLNEIRKVGSPKVSPADVKVTNMDSGNYHEYIPGLIDGGEVDVEQNYTKGDFDFLYTNNGVPLFWKITLTDGSFLAFPGYVKEPVIDPETEKEIVTKFKIRVSGEPTFTPGA